MNNVITQEQKKIIEQLTMDGYGDALVAYGSDMYQDGVSFGASMIESLYKHDLTEGFVFGAVTVAIVSLTAITVCAISEHIIHKKKKEESES